MYSRHMFLAVVAVLALNASLALANSAGLQMCEVTDAQMSRGMGGSASDLGFAIKVENPTPTGATVSITHSENTPLKGLLLWAFDASNKRIGTWTVKQGVTAYTPVSTCQGGAIAHNNPAVKPLKAGDAAAPEGFTLTVPKDAQGPLSVRAVIATGRTKWQITRAFSLQGVGSASGSGSAGATTTPSASTALGVSGAASLAAVAAAVAAVVA
ncbi:hypothetical protein BCR44DRAFT_1433908 [Catenaria anguillulae PL171]|uniref:Reelin domain-containing protein n=1 Tax=Catenaria anguillulae PL171 TaxID=765915 RepID=A0A1Y2HM38_9FUNG|nr:hypothetical protein BCR44DRAFT_1433908 [Catenaria anguillulae PL171]